jgi:predicted flap endonuclease-1-like 5' DNA nuclease
MEYYEAFGNLYSVQTALFGDDPASVLAPSDPMARWCEAVREQWGGNEPTAVADSYGSQQQTRTDCTVAKYRDRYGTADRTTDFQTIDTAPVPAAIRRLLEQTSTFSSDELAAIRVPMIPDSDTPLPVLVETDADYERATELLETFPSRPVTEPPTDAATETDDGHDDDTGVDETTDTKTKSTASTEEDLTEIGGITPPIEEALQAAGYKTKDDLRGVDKTDLMKIDGIDGSKANRIIISLSR